jgi:hypothetical protein
MTSQEVSHLHDLKSNPPPPHSIVIVEGSRIAVSANDTMFLMASVFCFCLVDKSEAGSFCDGSDGDDDEEVLDCD